MMVSNNLLRGKVSLITGASSGIGRALASGFAAAGAAVSCAARSRDRLDQLVAEIYQDGGSALAVQADVTDAIEALEIPTDLESAFANYSSARENFDAFPRSVKRSILEWSAIAKRLETRRKRVDETAGLAAENIRANQWRR
jgi:NAD(P)-dependent dehydrogenase (short-subunit alcohol dehydrogenase family)